MSEAAEPEGVLLSVAYDGTPFAGFASQPHRRTVADVLTGALRQLDPTITTVRGASRTDAGVHARDQRVAFDARARLPLRAWVLGPRRHLPPTVAITRAAYVPCGFTPRFEAEAKTYRYLIHTGPVADPLLVTRAWHVAGLEGDAARGALVHELAAAIGTHRFDAFRSSQDRRANTERTIGSASAQQHPALPRVVALEVTGDGFLHRMVRILVGTAVDVARGRLPRGAMVRALASGRRADAGVTAPPHGLYLARIRLRSEPELGWPPSPGR